MTTLYPLTAAQELAALRIDLSDTDNTAYRWADADLNRAIDKSVEKYSRANPLLHSLQQNTVAGAAIYPNPLSAFYVDKVEYPLGNWPRTFRQILQFRTSQLLPPSAADMAGVAVTPGRPGSGSILFGFNCWAFTYLGPNPNPANPPPETTLGPPTAFFSIPANGSATLTGIPEGPYGTVSRRIYRSTDAVTFKLVATIPDNLTGSYTDTRFDGSLGANPPNANTTADVDAFELQLPPELRPNDTLGIMEVTWAGKHQLDTNGTTIPEPHWDVLTLGALAFAMHQYQYQVNDNFEYADGHLRDRVDDTKSTVAWWTQCSRAMKDYDAALTLIREEANQGFRTSQLPQWGDVPLRWQRI